ncbi:MAG TPA: hypothetical protein VN962_21520 [Polyangia bacterium]|nr:hypothetical protein [Polyangia bacterium]
MKRRGLSPWIGGLLVVLCLVSIAFWRSRAASRAPAPADPASAEPAAPPPAAEPAPPPPAPPPPAPRRAPAVAEREGAPLDEAHLMARLRAVAASDPPQAIALAREGNRRWPHSADVPERTSILIHALAAAGRSSEARGEAERMVNQAPDSPWVHEVEQFTGAHRHRNVRVNDAGVIEYYDAPNK